jgi:drug/metabolite transporter (DMT)-like permease
MAAGLPVITALLGAALGYGRIGLRRGLSLAVVAGGCLLLGVATGGQWEGAWRGDLLFLGAIACWSVFTVLVQRWRLTGTDSMLVVGLLSAPLYLPVWWWLLPSTIGQAAPGLLLLQAVFHGALATVLAGFLYTTAVRSIGPGPTTMTGAAVPALAALIAWPVLGEPLPLLGVLAVGLVSVGMLIAVTGGSPARRSAGRDRP